MPIEVVQRAQMVVSTQEYWGLKFTEVNLHEIADLLRRLVLPGGDYAPSNDNVWDSNQCTAAPHNFFEITFSHGNLLGRNTARCERDGRECLYPLLAGGSDITLGGS